MLKSTAFLMISFLTVCMVFSNLGFRSILKSKDQSGHQKKEEQNHPPIVKILSPKNDSKYNWNSRVPYEISVSDKEDGESKYDEINPKEIFLEIEYVGDTSEAFEKIKKNNQKEAAGLAVIKASNCMNCHAFKSKLIGPSFEQICKKYPHLPKYEDTLSNHILKGSTGRWGTAQMPSNKDLTKSQAKEIIQWIFKNAANPNVNYIAGNEGSFDLVPPSNSSKYVLLTASYTDHGTKENPGQKVTGEDKIIIEGK